MARKANKQWIVDKKAVGSGGGTGPSELQVDEIKSLKEWGWMDADGNWVSARTDMTSMPRLDEPQRLIQRLFLMLSQLHRRGYERLRVLPGMSPSGMHYRCCVTPARNVFVDHGAIGINDTLIARHTSANGHRCFEWDDVETASPEVLADLFVERFPRIAKLGLGADPAYAAWFAEVLELVARGVFPIAYDDGYFGHDNPRPGQSRLPTTDGYVSGLRMPPPGRSRRKLFKTEGNG